MDCGSSLHHEQQRSSLASSKGREEAKGRIIMMPMNDVGGLWMAVKLEWPENRL